MEQAIEEFKKYTNNYLNLSDMCILKVNHTLRVMDLCEKIAKSLNLSSEDIELAKLCGLLHDIARFEQWKQYQTFADAKSIDHGDFGVEILKKDSFIRKFNREKLNDNLILKVVKNHNKYKIEEGLTEREQLFCNIVRDADKIDIIYLYITEEIVIDVEDEYISEKIYNQIENKNMIILKDRKTKADRLAISLSFIFDINYEESFKILKEKNYLNKEIDIYQKKKINIKLKEQLENIRKIVNDYIDGRCKNVR